MTNPQRNLNVVTRHLDDLARKHEQAADQLTGANREAAPAAASANRVFPMPASPVTMTPGPALESRTSPMRSSSASRPTIGQQSCMI